MKSYDIAKICHAVNKAYCAALGDDSQVDWEQAPEWQKESAIKGVIAHINNKNLTGKESHALWMEHKLQDGWVYGEEKNEEFKTHPCIVDYEELPLDQRMKDYLFKAVVDSAKGL